MGCNDHLFEKSIFKGAERTRYYPKQLITADDLTQDQIYQRDKRRMHNRMLHGWGIVCGLGMSMASGTHTATVASGYALSPLGDEIYLPNSMDFDLDRCLAPQNASCTNTCSGVITHDADKTVEIYLAIRFTECPTRPLQVPPVGCGCEETACEYSRYREGIEICCLAALPEGYISDAVEGNACPNPIDSPWVVLAKFTARKGAISQPDTATTSGRRNLRR